MGSLDAKLAAIRKFKNFPKVLNGIIRYNAAEIIDMNRTQMYDEGVVDVNNPGVVLNYAPSTIRQKKRRSKYKRTDHITLKDMGDFHKKMKLIINSDSFIITSTDDKWAHFSSGDWGGGRFQDALGLTEKNLSVLRGFIKSQLIIDFKDALQNS